MRKSPKSVDLHAIRDEILKVRTALAAVRETATPAERQDLDLKLKELEAINEATMECCSRVWLVWPKQRIVAAPKRRAPEIATGH